jgi:glutaredoxin
MVGGVLIHNFLNFWQEVSMSKLHVIIYSRPGCHLCDEAKAAIMSAGCNDQFTLEEVNIESDDELLRKYKYDIPVIAIDGVESFIHRVDPEEFRTRIKRIKSGFKSV